jgi:hypothetical protein
MFNSQIEQAFVENQIAHNVAGPSVVGLTVEQGL